MESEEFFDGVVFLMEDARDGRISQETFRDKIQHLCWDFEEGCEESSQNEVDRLEREVQELEDEVRTKEDKNDLLKETIEDLKDEFKEWKDECSRLENILANYDISTTES